MKFVVVVAFLAVVAVQLCQSTPAPEDADRPAVSSAAPSLANVAEPKAAILVNEEVHAAGEVTTQTPVASSAAPEEKKQ